MSAPANLAGAPSIGASSGNVISTHDVTPGQLERGNSRQSLPQSTALNRKWVHLDSSKIKDLLNYINPLFIAGKVMDHWEEMVMITGAVIAFINVFLNLIWGWISTSMAFAITGSICLIGFNFLRTNKRMQEHLNTFESRNLQLETNIREQAVAHTTQLERQRTAHEAQLLQQSQAHEAQLLQQSQAHEAAIKAHLDANTQQVKDHEKIIADLKTQYTATETLLKDQVATLSDAKQQIIREKEDVIKEKEALREEHENFKKLNQHQWKALTELHDEQKKLHADIVLKKAELQQKEAELQILEKESAQRRKDYEEHALKTIDNLKQKIQELENTYNQKETKLKELETKIMAATNSLEHQANRLSKKLNKSPTLTSVGSAPSSPYFLTPEFQREPRRNTLSEAEFQQLKSAGAALSMSDLSPNPVLTADSLLSRSTPELGSTTVRH